MSEWKAALAAMTGRTITGYATGAFGGALTSLTITLDDKSWITLSVPGVWEGEHIEVELHRTRKAAA